MHQFGVILIILLPPIQDYPGLKSLISVMLCVTLALGTTLHTAVCKSSMPVLQPTRRTAPRFPYCIHSLAIGHDISCVILVHNDTRIPFQ